MLQVRLTGPHGILILAKLAQAISREVFQSKLRLFGSYGPIEPLQPAGVIGKPFLDQSQYFLAHRIGAKSSWFGNVPTARSILP